MNAKLQAVQDLKRFSAQFKGILAIGEDLEKLGSLEQRIEESQVLLAKLQAERTTAEAAIKAAQAEKDAELEQAKTLRAKNMAEGKKIIDTAKFRAEEAAKAAEQKAVETRGGLEREYEAMRARVVSASKELQRVEAAIADRQKQLDTLTAHVASAKEAVARI